MVGWLGNFGGGWRVSGGSAVVGLVVRWLGGWELWWLWVWGWDFACSIFFIVNIINKFQLSN